MGTLGAFQAGAPNPRQGLPRKATDRYAAHSARGARRGQGPLLSPALCSPASPTAAPRRGAPELPAQFLEEKANGEEAQGGRRGEDTGPVVPQVPPQATGEGLQGEGLEAGRPHTGTPLRHAEFGGHHRSGRKSLGSHPPAVGLHHLWNGHVRVVPRDPRPAGSKHPSRNPRARTSYTRKLGTGGPRGSSEPPGSRPHVCPGLHPQSRRPSSASVSTGGLHGRLRNKSQFTHRPCPPPHMAASHLRRFPPCLHQLPRASHT